MRTFTAIALALGMLFTVTTANATTHKKHKHHASSTTKKDTSKGGDKAAEKDKAPAAK
jgi:hypothetical protein